MREPIPLHHAVASQFRFQVLIDAFRAGESLDLRDGGGATPLHAAIKAVGTGCTTPTPAYALIALGADVNAADDAGITPLHRACAAGKQDLVQLLLWVGARSDARDAQERLPLDHLPERTNLSTARGQIIAWLEGEPVPTSRRRLIPACAAGDLRAAQLLRNGSNPDSKDSGANRPLHRCRNPWLMAALLALGADPNARNRAGQTPLHFACKSIGQEIRLLLDNGADPSIADSNGRLPVDALEAQHYEPDFYDGDRLQRTRDDIIATLRRAMS